MTSVNFFFPFSCLWKTITLAWVAVEITDQWPTDELIHLPPSPWQGAFPEFGDDAHPIEREKRVAREPIGMIAEKGGGLAECER